MEVWFRAPWASQSQPGAQRGAGLPPESHSIQGRQVGAFTLQRPAAEKAPLEEEVGRPLKGQALPPALPPH